MSYKALLALHRRISNVRKYRADGSVARYEPALWEYHWTDERDREARFPWWLHHHSLLSAAMFGEIAPRQCGTDDLSDCTLNRKPDSAIVFSPDGSEPVRIRIARSSDISLVAKRGGKGDVRTILKSFLRKWFKVENPTPHDMADLIRWAVRDPDGPIVDTAMLCWPETALYLLDYLKIDKSSIYSYINDILPTSDFEKAFPPPNKEGWVNVARGEREEKSIMTEFLEKLEEDFGNTPEFPRNFYRFICSLSELGRITIDLSNSESGHISLPPYRKAHDYIPILPHSFEESRANQGRPNASYATLDLIAALYLAAILGPQPLSELFSKVRHGGTQDSGADEAAPLKASSGALRPISLRPIILTEYSFGSRAKRIKGKRGEAGFDHTSLSLITSPETDNFGHIHYKKYAASTTGNQYYALPHQTIVLTRQDGPAGLGIQGEKYVLAHIEDGQRRVSDIHAEIRMDEDGGRLMWHLFDRGGDGTGSTNGTFIIRDNGGMLLKADKRHGHVTADFINCYSYFFEDKDSFPIIGGNKPLRSTIDGNCIWNGVRLNMADCIILAPIIAGKSTRPVHTLTFYTVGFYDAPTGRWEN